MADEPDSLVLKLLRELRSGQDQIVSRLDHVKQRLDEIHETLYTSAGIALHANARHEVVAKELADVKRRLDKLEEKA